MQPAQETPANVRYHGELTIVSSLVVAWQFSATNILLHIENQDRHRFATLTEILLRLFMQTKAGVTFLFHQAQSMTQSILVAASAGLSVSLSKSGTRVIRSFYTGNGNYDGWT